MLSYEKLPKKTPSSIVAGILSIGICLSYGLIVSSVIISYCIIGVFSVSLYPSSSIVISTREAIYLLAILFETIVTTTMIGFLAFYMDKLSKKAIHLSRVMFIPTFLTALLVQWQHSASIFNYHVGKYLLLAVWISAVATGILPALFLNTKGARKLHAR